MKPRPGRGKGNEWLLIKKRDDSAQPGWNVEDFAWSVLSGRGQEEIAQNLPARKIMRRAGQLHIVDTKAVDPEAVWRSTRTPSGAAKQPAALSAAKPITAKAITQKSTTAKSAAAKQGRAKIAVMKPRAASRHSKLPQKHESAGFDAATLKGARKKPMPDWFEPMSASLVKRAPESDDWLFEVKWDGVRALCFLDEGELRIFSRRGRRCERQYPELSVLPHYVSAHQAVLDGEIAVLDKHGVSRFELIQPRIANSDPAAVARLAHNTPAVLFVFDILYLDGYDLREVALSERRRALLAVLTPSDVARVSESFTGGGEELLAAAKENGLEGIVAKRASSCYESRRSREWLKLKLVNEQEFVVCGFTAGERSVDWHRKGADARGLPRRNAAGVAAGAAALVSRARRRADFDRPRQEHFPGDSRQPDLLPAVPVRGSAGPVVLAGVRPRCARAAGRIRRAPARDPGVLRLASARRAWKI
jgi:bifunctional non-homologous end joining protein LigD